MVVGRTSAPVTRVATAPRTAFLAFLVKLLGRGLDTRASGGLMGTRDMVQEDRVLSELVVKHGPRNWSQIAEVGKEGFGIAATSCVVQSKRAPGFVVDLTSQTICQAGRHANAASAAWVPFHRTMLRLN